GNKITTGPEILTTEITSTTSKLPRYLNDTFALDISNHIGYSIFGRNTDAPVDAIAHSAPLNPGISPLVTMQYPENPLLMALGNKYHVIHTVLTVWPRL